MKTCKTSPGQVNPSDLTFATKFVAIYLFIKVKGSRPMTYQYLTMDMIGAAKENGGFIDQIVFKTAGRYGFDSLILTDASMQVLDSYINFVRPLLKPRSEFVLVTRNGGQHSKLGGAMSKWKIHPSHSLSSNSRDSKPQSTQQHRGKDSVGRSKT